MLFGTRTWVCLTCMVLIAVFWGGVGGVQASSIWNDRAVDLFSEHRARDVGDIVTIIVSESATASQKATTSSKESSSAGTDAGVGLLRFLSQSSAGAKNDFSGDGTTSRSGTLSARITAVISKKLPNGNLVIEGVRRIKVNRETQEIVLSGIIRPQDITEKNTIESTYLANAEIKYKGSGSIGGDLQRPGFINKIFNFLF